MHVVFGHWGHNISKVNLLSLNSLSLIKSIRIAHKLVNIIHLLRSAPDVILGQIALALGNARHHLTLVIFSHIDIGLLAGIHLAFGVVLLDIDLLHI